MSVRSAVQVRSNAAQAVAAALCLSLISGTVARAQQDPPTALPPVTMTPPPASEPPSEPPPLLPLPPSLVPPSKPLPPAANSNQGTANGAKTDDGKGEGKAALEKLNHDLKRKVDEVNPTIASPPLDARSPDTKIGVINIPGVQQQYGSNFGKSAVPYRPPPMIYTAPMGHR